MSWDDLVPRAKAPAGPVVGEDLSKLSVADLNQRVMLLDAEIQRVKAEIEKRQKQSSAADALFKN